MLIPNMNYANLGESYLFFNIAQKVKKFQEENPAAKLVKMGIGDVTLPLCEAVIKKLHEAVDDQASPENFHGYMPECGDPVLRQTIADYYKKRGVELSSEEVFVSSGASDELGDITDLFSRDTSVLIMEPAYPAYVDASIMGGRKIIHLDADRSCGFTPAPDDSIDADVIYICSPNNPTGAVFTREKLQEWVDFANKKGSVILFDAAYEAFIEDPELPHSIFELPGSKECAIEICSLSKTAGFTGTRFGYTVIPKNLERNGMNLNTMWVRNRTTKTNGVSYILQKGASAVFTPEGQEQVIRNLAVYKKNAAVISSALDEAGIWYCGGKNAPYIWMQCPDKMGSWEFFDYLLKEAQVVGTPGEGFGKCGEGFFRLTAFGNPEDTLLGAQRLKELLMK